MQTFVVLLHEPESMPGVSGMLKKAGFEVYDLADNAVVVRRNGAITRDVTNAVGLSVEGGVPGVVFKLADAVAGYSKPELWEWIDMHAGGGE